MRLSPYRVPRSMFRLFGALLFVSLLGLAYRLGMLTDGFSTEPWERVGLWQRGGILLGIFIGCMLVTFVTYVVLSRLGISLISSAECSAKARELTLKVCSKYLMLFKVPTGEADVDILIEDLPFRGSPEEAKRFLEDNADLHLAEELYRQAIALAGEEEEVQSNHQVWNAATAYNKLGYHYRLVGDWDKALESLGEVFPLLDLLASSPLALQEKAAASFHFGLVHMARFRQFGKPEDRKTARAFFEDSIERASRLGFDAQTTRKLLESL